MNLLGGHKIFLKAHYHVLISDRLWIPLDRGRLGEARYYADQGRLLRSGSLTVVFGVAGFDVARSPSNLRGVPGYTSVMDAPCNINLMLISGHDILEMIYAQPVI